MGDFNSHHTLWGCMDTNDKGRSIKNFVTKHDLVLLNDKSLTYLHPVLVLIHHWILLYAALEFDFTLKVCDDLHGSDHFPIQVSEVGLSVQQRPQRWKLHKANWKQFRVYCEQSIHPNAFEDCENPTELFTSLLYSAANFDKSEAPKQAMVK